MIRKATAQDLPAIEEIYLDIHAREESGEITTGWIRDVYPVRRTAEEALRRGDMFVLEEDDGQICGSAVINQLQVDVYEDGEWKFAADDDEVMVLHTLVISSKAKGRGLGRQFVAFYEQYAADHGCNELRMDTNARNQAARALYRELGYEEIGIVPTVFNGIPGVDLVLLEKHLD